MARGSKAVPDLLARIVAREREVVASARVAVPVDTLRRQALYEAPRRSFAGALASRRPAVIAECKRRSPSRGILRDPFDPVSIARSYASAGAAAISVLTNEEFFGGTLEDLRAVRATVDLPLLRKDFIIDPYQIHEARAAGADAVLLIAAIHPPDVLRALHETARELTLDVLVEVHEESELEAALRLEGAVLGINNRDLRTFATDLATSEKLARKVPGDRLVVAESGLRDHADVVRLERAGLHAFLVGETFMRAADPGAALRELMGSEGP